MAFSLVSLFFFEGGDVEYDRPSLNPFYFVEKMFASCSHCEAIKKIFQAHIYELTDN